MAEESKQTPKEEKVEGGETQTQDTPKEGTQPEGTGQTTPTEGESTSKQEDKEDYKEKFSESARENQRLLKEVIPEKDKTIAELETKLVDKTSETPSDKELAEKYPEWEFKEEEEKQRIRREEERERRLRKLEENSAWDKDYSDILKQFPQLKDREVEFKELSYQKENRKVPLEVLAKSFLFEEKKEPEPKKEPEEPRKGLEKPTGGGQAPGPELSLEDVKRLRKTDFKRYIKLVREGRIKDIPEK